MQISKINTHLLQAPLPEPFESSSMQFKMRHHLLVEIHCDNGLIGWGECLGQSVINQQAVKVMAQTLIGESPLEIEKHWITLYNKFRDQGQRGTIINALSGLDVALWDIAGQFYQQPISTLLGGRFRESIEAYATGGFRPSAGNRLKALEEELQGFVEAGFNHVKIKIGFNLQEDIEAIRLARRIIGPKRTLMIDANHGYDALSAVTLARAVKDQSIAWFEEPVVPECVSAYQQVRAQQSIPIAAGETWHTRWGIHEALKQGAVDIIQPDICGVGGITEARKILTLADVHGVRCVPHVWGTGVAMAAALHFHSAMPPSPPSFGSQAALLEFDQTDNPFRTRLLRQPINAVNGWVDVPKTPGLGIEINTEALAEFTDNTQ
jgi:D-galactarolactone cycloisomerase